MSDDAELLRRAAARVREMGAAAVAGPWIARHTTNDGWPIELEPREAGDDPEDYDGEFGGLALVAGTALPRTNRGQEGRGPGHYQSHHVLAETEECDLAPVQAQEVLDSYRWAAMVSPHVAEALAAWLEAEADLVPAVAEVGETVPKLLDAVAEGEGVETKPWEVSVRLSTTPSAVAMARVLLGEEVAS